MMPLELIRNKKNKENDDLVGMNGPQLKPLLQFDAKFDEEENDGNKNGNKLKFDPEFYAKYKNLWFTNNSFSQDESYSYSKLVNQTINLPSLTVNRQAPSFLLIESLIWEIVCYKEKDYKKQKPLYFNLCKILETKNFIGSTYKLDSLQTIRESICFRLNKLIDVLQKQTSFKGVNDVEFQREYLNALGPENFGQNHILGASQYTENFTVIKLIERGGFGSVYRAKHNLDDFEYAVKMIRFKYRFDGNSFMKILREVQLYANLSSHPNVVAYKTTWLENWCLHDDGTSFLDQNNHHPAHNHDDNKKNKKNEFKKEIVTEDTENNSHGFSIRFEESSKSGIRLEHSNWSLKSVKTNIDIKEIEPGDEESVSSNVESNYQVDEAENDMHLIIPKRIKHTSVSSTKSNSDSAIEYGHADFNMTESEEDKNEIKDNCFVKDEKCKCKFNSVVHCTKQARRFGAVLYIQMELCGKNLKIWLRERNNRIFKLLISPSSSPTSSSSPLQLPPTTSEADVFDQIDVNANLAIFKQILKGVDYIHSKMLIHRDLKPQNILFSVDGSKVKIGDFGLATLHHVIDNEEILLQNNCFCESHDQFNHTGGLGTTIYAAPEQKLGSVYDNKADLYSLGIILLELFYPFTTDMEKIKYVDHIKKKRKISDEFEAKWPSIAQMILQLTHKHPELRPTAYEVLRSDLFLPKEHHVIKDLEHQINSLRLKLEQKDTENKQLKTVVSLKDKELLSKEKEIQKLKSTLDRVGSRLSINRMNETNSS